MAKTKTYYPHTLLILMLAMLISACGEQKQDTGAAMPALPVGVIEAQPTSVPIRAEAVAQTEGAKEVEVRPRVGGILLKKLFQEGEPIKAGQTMFLIDPVPFQIAVQQAEAQLAQQRARIVQTQREADRLKGLLETQSISQREFDNALSDNSVASASMLQYEAMLREAKLNLSYTTVTAPTSGIAGRFEFSEGALVSANTSLLTTIVQLSPIWVRFSLSDSELAALGGQLTSRNVKNIQLLLPDGTEHPESGKLNFSASEIDPALGTQQLRAVFENAERNLLPGQFVRARITTGTRDGVFILPQTSVQTNDQGKFVYVAEKDATGKVVAAIRPIQEGGWEGKNWVILGGLKAGDKVIADNLIKIRPGAEVVPHPLGDPPSAAPKTSAKAPAKTSA
ncbi:MAG: efflux transporter periplasmic adaptor subunit [Methylophilaceae bacterium 17-43-7]|jgi:membrane fusion protein (multidrug efflux system)|nr:MAG: efflux transporter periplasmic adaptor subunit [Methylophilaceae bacterium 17-43-7]